MSRCSYSVSHFASLHIKLNGNGMQNGTLTLPLLQNSSSTVCLGSPHTPPRHFHCAIFLTMASFAEGIWHGVSGHSFFSPHFLINNVKQEFCLCPKQTELQIIKCWIFPCLCHFPGIVCTCLAVVCVFLFVVCFSCFSLVCVRSLLFAGVREDARAYVKCYMGCKFMCCLQGVCVRVCVWER